jgi:predicted ribosomally synthesized peptide with nif11-like leader
MSKENLEQFIQKVTSSEELQARIGEEIDAETLIALGAEHGCEFTAEDLAENAELSDEELDGVAGGVSAIKNKQEPFREVDNAERSLTGGNSTKYSIGRSPTKYTEVDWS